jgi:hypothetical protein
MRQPELEDAAPESDARHEALAQSAAKPHPRWLVVSGLILYCAVFWGVLFAAGDWLFDTLR